MRHAPRVLELKEAQARGRANAVGKLAQRRALVRLAGRDSGVRYRVIALDSVCRWGVELFVVLIRPDRASLSTPTIAVDPDHLVLV